MEKGAREVGRYPDSNGATVAPLKTTEDLANEMGVKRPHSPAPERPGDIVADWCARPQEEFLEPRAYLSRRVARCMAWRAVAKPGRA